MKLKPAYLCCSEENYFKILRYFREKLLEIWSECNKNIPTLNGLNIIELSLVLIVNHFIC